MSGVSAFAEGYGGTAFARSSVGPAQPKLAQRAKAGGAERDRTADLVIANDALSQLSYGPFGGGNYERRRAVSSAGFWTRGGDAVT